MTLSLTDPARLAAFCCSSPIDDPTCVVASLMCSCACCAATPMFANLACISPVAARTALAAACIPDWRSSVWALMTTLVSRSAIIVSQLIEDHGVLSATSTTHDSFNPLTPDAAVRQSRVLLASARREHPRCETLVQAQRGALRDWSLP